MTCQERCIRVGVLLKEASGYQKLNFLMILLVWFGQFSKPGYDSNASTWLSESIKKEDYYDLSGVYLFNQFIVYLDGMIIFMGAVSLTNYSTSFMPDLHIVMTTVERFISTMFVKTFILIWGVYLLLGMTSMSFLNLYQFGFVDLQFSLLRSCIVFMNGFMLNEQYVFLSAESLESTMNNNGFWTTFIHFIVFNIVIR